jgi:catechol 2,3-dioxygenase-like lactoylglutathione lyase family enzyme
MEGSQTSPAKETLLKPLLLSHGTVECRDIEAAKRFYTEVLGMEAVRTSKISLMLRLNSTTTIAAVQTRGPNGAGHYSHFGLDFATREEVDAAWETLKGVQEEYGIRKITRPADQHGAYAFYIEDMDGNWWEFLTNPPDGYSYVFELEEDDRAWRDQNMGADRAERYEAAKKGG